MRRVRSPSRLIAAFALLGFAAPAWTLDATRKPTQYTLQKWDAGTGLPHESIQALVQTPDGYLWLGTMCGLVRFDGVRFTHYTPRNSALPHSNVWSLAVDAAGRLWLGTDGNGVAIWKGDGTVEHFGKAQGLTSDKVRPIFMAKDGSVWVATNGGGVNRYHDGRWTALTTKEGLANDYIWSLAEDDRGRIWIGTNGKGIDVWEAGKIVAHHDVKDGLPQGAIAALTFARNGDLWVGTFDGLARLRHGRWTRWTRKEGLPARVVRTIREDSDGNIWVGTAEGVARIQGDTIEALPAEEGAYVRAMIEDREGNLWVGLFGAGLRRLSDETFFAVGRAEGAPFLATYTVLEAHDGAMWVGTYRGAWRVKDGVFTSVTARDGLPSDSIGPLAEDREGGMWIGTTARGLADWRAGKIRKFTQADGLPSDGIRTIVVDRTGTVWAGTTQGLGEFRDGRWRPHAAKLPNDVVRVLLEGGDGSLWAGTATGLARYRDGEWTTVPIAETKAPSILALYEDAEARLWVGTADQGLCHVAGGSSACFRVEGELFDGAISCIVEDGLGHLWISSAKGVVRVAKSALGGAAPKSQIPFEAFGRDDGMRTSQVNGGFTPGGMRARDGRLWFPTMTGLTAVDPHRIEKNTLAPVVRIEELHADGSPVTLGEPVLGPGVRRLELRYTGLSLSSLDKVSFRYRLDPFDTEWIEAETRRVAYYTSLPAGRYVFRVTACNNDGACDEKGASTSFTLRPLSVPHRPVTRARAGASVSRRRGHGSHPGARPHARRQGRVRNPDSRRRGALTSARPGPRPGPAPVSMYEIDDTVELSLVLDQLRQSMRYSYLMNTHIRTARALADDALLARVKSLADRERDTTTELIAHLAEVERRKLHLASGYSSMFTYCLGALRLSESETFNRIRAARAAGRFPVILDQLAAGLVNLTTVKLLSPHLTAANHLEVLRSARSLSRREVEKIVARLAPAPDAPTSVRKLPPPKPALAAANPVAAVTAEVLAAASVIEGVSSPPPPAPPTPIPTPAEVRPAVVSALSPERYKLQLTISGETLEKLDRAKDMLRHALPSGDVAQIVDRALTLLLADLEKKKFAATDSPRPARGMAAHAAPPTQARKASAPVRRIVSERDTRQCTFVGKDGRRCQERAFLEFHHVDPYVEGGPPTVPNIVLLCQQHNLYEWHLRSTDVREREEEWLYRQVAAGIVPWTAATGSGPSWPGRSRAEGSRAGTAPPVAPPSS